MQLNFSLVLLLLTGLALSQVLATSKELEASSELKDLHDEEMDIEEADEDQDRSKKEAAPCVDNQEELETVEHPEEALSVAILIEEPKPEIISLALYEGRTLNIDIPVDHVRPAEETPLQAVDIEPPVQLYETIKIQPAVQPPRQATNVQPATRPMQAINIQPAVRPPHQAINVQPAVQPPKAVNIQPGIRPLQAVNIQPAIRPPQAVNFQPVVRPPQAIHPFIYRPHVPSPPAVNHQPAEKPAPPANAEPSAKPVPYVNLTAAQPAVSPYNVLPMRVPLANFNPISLPKYRQFDPRIDYESRRLIGAPNGNLDLENFNLQQVAPLNPAYRSPLSPPWPLPLERFYRPRTPFEVMPPFYRPPRRQCYRYWPQTRFQHPYYQRPYAGIAPAELMYDRPIRYLEFGEPPALDSLYKEQRD